MGLAHRIEVGDVKYVRKSLEEGLDPNATDELGRTPLQWAAHFGRPDIVRLLLDHGAQVEIEGPLGTALHEAAWMGRPEVAKLLIGAGGNAGNRSSGGESVLEIAVRGAEAHPERSADYEEVITLIEASSVRDSVLEAAAVGDMVALERLLTEGESVTQRGRSGSTPLHLATEGDHLAAVRLLLKAGAPVAAQDDEGSTPLHRAARQASASTASTLLDAGALINAQNDFGQTPLLIAVEGGRTEVAELLLEHGADAGVSEKYSWTPLHSAAANGDLRLVEVLLDQGANPSAKNDGGMTPAEVARRYSHTEVAIRIESAGRED
jgi:ankyrin repeat protein